MLVNLPTKHKEPEAAQYLGVSESFLRQERSAGNIGFVKLGRKIYYLDRHLLEYIEAQECPKIDSKLENTGSPSVKTASDGARRGTTKKLDKQTEYRSALRLLKKPSKG